MKKLSYLLLLALGILGAACDDTPLRQEAQVHAQRRQGVPQYSVIRIEGCEYLRQETSNGYPVFAHKGNCSNPIHPYRDTTRRPTAR